MPRYPSLVAGILLGVSMALAGGLAVRAAAPAGLASGAAGDPAAIDRAFQQFWEAQNPRDAAKAVARVVATGVDFEEAWKRLRQDRPYLPGVAKGLVRWTNHTSDGVELQYTVSIPESYDAARAHPLRIQLHGGIMGRESSERGLAGPGRLPGTIDEIGVFPSGFNKASWWNFNQVENLATIVDRVKRTYHVDTNHVYLTGVSDGGTGVYYQAMHDTTPYCCFLPLNGFIMVLANHELGVQGGLYPGNLLNKPFFIVNGGRDRLYPISAVQPYLVHLKRIGVVMEYRPQPEAGHDTSWWPTERANFERFVKEHARDPLPDRITWETDRADRFNRAHWLVIDRLGPEAGETAFNDPNVMQMGKEIDFGVRVNSRIGRGNKLVDVLAGSNAYAIGLRKDDVILEIDGTSISSTRELIDQLQHHPIGAPIAFMVNRNGKRQEFKAPFRPELMEAPPAPLFVREQPSGRVDLVRQGNEVEVKTHGVKAYSLLLSPDRFDFSKPVRVTTNGHVSFAGMVRPDLGTLLEWAARDNDPSMLFGARVQVEVGTAAVAP